MKTASTSTQDHSASEAEGTTDSLEHEYFDPSNPEHCARVKEWCTTHWESTIKRSMLSFNPLIYHDCCFCFSKRGFSKKANHRPLESSSILRIPTLKTVTSPEGLYKWLLSKAKSHRQAGRQTLFPAINRLHEDHDDEDDLGQHHVVYLAKRTEDLAKELHSSHKTIETLTAENKKLLVSSKTWYARYQDAVSSEDTITDWDNRLKSQQPTLDLIN